MKDVLDAEELLEKFRAVAELDAKNREGRVKWDDPLDIALVGCRTLIRGALKAKAGDPATRAVQNAINTPWPTEVRRRHPTHEADSLMILAWAAKCALRDDDPRTPHPQEITWFNRTLETVLSYDDRRRGRETSEWLGKTLYNFLYQRIWKENYRKEEQSALDDFWRALTNAPTTLLNTTVEELQEEALKGDGNVAFRPDGTRKTFANQLDEPGDEIVEIFRQSFFLRGDFHIVVGARALHPAGLRLHFSDDSRAPFSKYYDLYAVWNLDLGAESGAYLSPAAFVSVQGLFIPVDMRHRLCERFADAHQRHKTAALVARNLSHNLGSHALFYIARNLREQGFAAQDAKSETGGKAKPTDVADLLQYLGGRADLVAQLASGSGHPFSAVLPIEVATEQFDQQSLLHRYLCASERLTLDSPVLVKGYRGAIDLPGGLLGAQALCAILENFARNSAKHSKRTDPGRLSVKLVLEVEPPVGGLLCCRLSDANAAPIVADENFDSLQKKAEAIIDPPASPWSGQERDLNVGFGLEEIATWLAYLRQLNDRNTWSSEPVVMRYERNAEGQLVLVFFLIPAVRVRLLPVADLGQDESTTRAQLSLIRCDWRTELEDPTRVQGRWLRFLVGDEHIEFSSRFGEFKPSELKVSNPTWRGVECQPNDANLAFAAYIETLRSFALHEQPLNVVVADANWFPMVREVGRLKPELYDWLVELECPHPQIRLFAAHEKGRKGGGLLPEDLSKVLSSGAIAVWHRHGAWLESRAADSFRDRLVHYESYAGGSKSDYTSIFLPQLARSPEDLLFLYGQLAEACLLKGYLIDERFGEICYNAKILEQLRWMGIHVIHPYQPSEINLPKVLMEISDPPRAPHTGGEVAQSIPASFVSIHASLRRSPNLMDGREWKDLLDRFCVPIPLVSLHSGRGGIEEVKNLNYPFFPASLFQAWAVERPCKLFLAEALMRGGWS